MMNIEVDIFQDETGNTLIRTLEPIEFSIDWQTVTIPKGFISDGASIPRCLWCIIDPPVTAVTMVPSIIHDYLYRYQICTRATADELYDDLLRKNGYSSFKRWLVKVGLSYFGGKAWREHTEELRKNK